MRKDNQNLKDKVVVISGGNSGIGLAAARLFALYGASVAVTGRNKSTLEAAAGSVGKDAMPIVADVSDLHQIRSSYEQVFKQFGKIDVLVVNAGVGESGPLADFTEEQFDRVSDTNFKGSFFSVQLALPYLNDGASVILVSSATNEKGFPGYAAYAASKAAIRSLARSFSSELMHRNIRVNAISPGAIDTPFYGRAGETPEQVQGVKEYMAASMIPAKRLGSSEEVAEAILFLASEGSAYMRGSELVMDGGVKTL